MAILVIADPDKNIRKTILEILKPFKHTLIEAEDGETVLKVVKEKKVHAVLFDADLPIQSISDIIPEVKKIRYNTAVVAMVSMGEDTKGLMSRGALTTLTKPFSVQGLRRVVTEAIDHATHAPKEPPPTEGSPAVAKASAHWKKVVIGIASVLILLSGAFAGFYFWKSKRVPLKFYSIPYNNLSALTPDGEWLWTCDWFNQSVYRHSPDAVLSLNRTHNHEDWHPSALAWDGKNIWTYAAWENSLTKHTMDKTLTSEQVIENLPIRPYALSFDGKSFWYVDNKKGELGRFNPEKSTLKIHETFPSPGRKPIGVSKGEHFLWSSDAQSGLIYKHSLDKGYPVLEAYALPDEVKNDKITCFWSDGKIFWVGSANSQKVYQFRKNHLNLAASND